MKKGRHRRYEEARALKRGPDLDIEAIFEDLESDRPAPLTEDPEAPLPSDDDRVVALDDDPDPDADLDDGDEDDLSAGA